MSADLYFAVPLLVRDVQQAIHEAIHAKVSEYLKTDAAVSYTHLTLPTKRIV